MQVNKKVKEQAGRDVMSFIKKYEKHGPRLPGSKAEQKASEQLVKDIKATTGVDAVKEDFTVAPRSGIGAIPYTGYAAFFALLVYYLGFLGGSHWHAIEAAFTGIAMGIMACVFIFAVLHIFLYKTPFDFLFKKAKSSNVIAELPARDKKDQFTIIYSGHIDSSWTWLVPAKTNPLLMIPITGVGLVCMLVFLVICIIKFVGNLGDPALHLFYDSADTAHFFIWGPAVASLGFFALIFFMTHSEKKASPGAMDNLSGTGLALECFKYFNKNPDKIPDNCRIAFAGLGSEEAGLRGAFDFVKNHITKGDLLVPGKTYVVNIDSIADKDHFEVIKGDIWQGTRFSKDMCNLLAQSISETGKAVGQIYNPVGGCDSTPFCKKNIDTVTFAAQDPKPSWYYHTMFDKSERFEDDVLADGFEVVMRLTDKIVEYHEGGRQPVEAYVMPKKGAAPAAKVVAQKPKQAKQALNKVSETLDEVEMVATEMSVEAEASELTVEDVEVVEAVEVVETAQVVKEAVVVETNETDN